MADTVDIRVRTQGAREAAREAKTVGRGWKQTGRDVEVSGREARKGARGYEYASNKLRLFGRASVGIRERTLGMASAMIGVTGAAFALERVVRDSTEAWSEQRKVNAQTTAVLKSTGGQANVTRGHLDQLSRSLAKKTAIDHGQIQSAGNLLLTFRQIHDQTGKGNKIFDQATKASVDLSAAMHLDLRQAALQVGKALNDPAKGMTRLQRIGVTFTKGQTDQVKALEATGHHMAAQKIILGELNKEFKGSAAAQATPADRLKMTVHDLEESLGHGLQPAVDAVDGALTKMGEKALPHVEKLATDVNKIFGRKDLTTGQKLSLSFKAAKTDLGPFVHDVEHQVEGMHLGDKLSNAFEQEVPKLADAAGRAAPRVARAFVNAFMNAGPIGKLATIGLILGKSGAFGAGFSWAGRKAAGRLASALGRSSAIDAAGTTAGDTIASKMGGAGSKGASKIASRLRAYKWSSVGTFVGLGIGLALTDALQPQIDSVAQSLADLITGVNGRQLKAQNARHFKSNTAFDPTIGGQDKHGHFKHAPVKRQILGTTRTLPPATSHHRSGYRAGTAVVQIQPSDVHIYTDGQKTHRAVVKWEQARQDHK